MGFILLKLLSFGRIVLISDKLFLVDGLCNDKIIENTKNDAF